MVSDGEVFVASGECGFGHFADGVAAIGFDGVHVDVAADVGLGDEVREGVGEGGFEFAGVFSEFGRDPVQAECAIDLFFGGSGDERAVFDAGEGVLA